MKDQISLIVELQELDTKMITHSRTIKDIPARINTMQKPLEAAEAVLSQARKDYEALEKKKRDRETAVEDNKAHVQKLSDRTKDVKDNKAYQAHLKEIETVERATVKLEDEVLAAMEKIEAAAQKLKAAEAAVAEENNKLEVMKRELAAEEAEARAALDQMKKGRSGLADKINKDLFKQYMNLLVDKGGVAVTSVEDEICTGCNMNIMPQLVVEIQKYSEIITCPQCRRILYYPEPQPGDESQNQGKE